jgi:TP901 family phage tail tape measure protein
MRWVAPCDPGVGLWGALRLGGVGVVALATAFVSVRPDTDTKAFQKDADAAGTSAGKAYSESFTRDSQGRLRQANGKFATDAQKQMLAAGGKSGKGFGESFTKTGSGVISKGFGKLKGSLGPLLIPLGVAGAITAIGKIGIEYENNLNIFQAVTKATGVQMDQVASKARALGADVKLPGVSAAGAAAAMTELSKAGFSVQQSMDAARGTLQLARVANISEAEAAEIAANAVNAFGIQAKDTGFVVDELAASANSSSIDIDEASDSFKMAAAVFSGFQGSAVGGKEAITELNTAIAILGNNGIKGSDAGTSLKQMLLQLTGPSAQAKDLMMALAINAAGANVSLTEQNEVLHGSKKVRQDAIKEIKKLNPSIQDTGDIAFTSAGKMRPLRDIIALVTAGTKGMSDEDKDYAITQIFGADASRSVIALMKGGLPVYDAQRKAVMQQGAAATVAAAQNKGLGGAIDNVKSQFENAAIAIYEQVKGPLTTALNSAANALSPLAGGIENFANFVRNNSGVIGGLATSVAGAVGAFAALRAVILLTIATQKAYAVAQTAIAFIQLASQVRSFAGAWALLDAAMDANPIGVVVIALGALVAGLIYAYKHSETFRAVVQGALHGIVVAAQAVATFFTGVIWPALQAAWNGIGAGALWLWHNAIEPAWHGIQAVVSVVVGVVKAIIYGFEVAVRAVGAVVTWLYVTIFRPIFAAISKVVQIWWLAVEISFKLFQLGLRVIVLGALYVARAVFGAVFGFINRNVIQPWWLAARVVFAAFRTYILGPVISTLTTVKNFFASVFRAIGTAVSTWWHVTMVPAFNAVKSAFNAVASAFSSVYNRQIKPVFTGFIGFMKTTVVGGFKTAVSAIGKAWSAVQDAAKKPVTFVVTHVINPFINGLNTVARAVGVKDQVAPIKGFATGGEVPGYASGGRISGAPSSTDNRLAPARIPGVGAVQLAGGEFVVNASDTRKALPLLRWINAGMKGGGSRGAARRIGRPMADMPGDGSEGWQFADGGLIGWAKDAWGAITNPSSLIKKPFESALSRLPGSGMIKEFLVGSANKLLNGALSWIGKLGGSGKVGDAVKFLHAQDGKPYLWDSAGPNGYDCSGIVSAVYNILHGHSPYSHTFSTSNAASFFPKPGQNGPMAAAWSHPGQAPAGASVGHMMGRVGNMNFESTGSRGVHLGSSTRNLSDFANIGHYADGGLLGGAPIRLFDQGGFWPSGTLGANLSGRTEYVNPRGGRSGGGDIHLHFHDSVITTREAAKDLVVQGLKDAKRARQLPELT